MQTALQGIEELAKHCDSLITVPNEKLITVLGRDATMISAFKAANEVLMGAVQGISELITRPGIINVDFADVRTVMSEMGLAMMGSGTARGDDRAQAAAQSAVNNPLLDEVNLHGANGVLVNITAGPNFTMREFDEVGSTIEGFASEDATVIVGTVLDPNMGDEVRVTVVATGLNQARGGKAARPVLVEPVQDWRQAGTGTHGPVPFDPVDPPGLGGISSTLRRSGRTEPTTAAAAPATALSDLAHSGGQSYLDIPSFLRRQAD
jgi:cell division protein FtsZ